MKQTLKTSVATPVREAKAAILPVEAAEPVLVAEDAVLPVARGAKRNEPSRGHRTSRPVTR